MAYSRYTSTVRVRNNTWRLTLFGIVMLSIGVAIGGIGGVFLFIRITGGTSGPSAPISAPTLSLEMIGTSNAPTGAPTALPTIVSGIPVIEARITSTPSITQHDVTTVVPTALPPQIFRIVSEESEARFSVSETMPLQTAIGRTNQVAGDIIVDFNTPSNSRIGTIRINLRTLQTDDANRDRSIRCCVLLSAQDAYEFSDFVPTSISGLPEKVQIGQEIVFQVTGDLTIRGITRSVMFNVSLTIISANELRGIGHAVVNRSEFGILNDAENMFDYHGVAEAVTLEFEFVARAVPQ